MPVPMESSRLPSSRMARSLRPNGWLIEQARRDSIRVVFYQSQFPASTVEVIAEDIGAQSVRIDPLAEDVVGNISYITDLITAERL